MKRLFLYTAGANRKQIETKEAAMLSMRECEVQECVRQDRLRESEHHRLVRLVSQQNESKLQRLLDQFQNRSNHQQKFRENRSLVS